MESYAINTKKQYWKNDKERREGIKKLYSADEIKQAERESACSCSICIEIGLIRLFGRRNQKNLQNSEKENH